MAAGFQTRDLFLLAWVLPIAALVGAFIGFTRAEGADLLVSTASGALTGLIIGFLGTVSEAMVFSNQRIRLLLRLP